MAHLVAGVLLVVSAGGGAGVSKERWPTYGANPFVIKTGIPSPKDSAGGLIVADVNDDGLKDYLVTVPGHVGARSNDGNELWTLKNDVRVGNSSERHGLPGHHGPGIQAGDVDGDGTTEVLFLTQGRKLFVVEGKTGKTKWTAKPPVPKGAERWEHLVVVNFRGKGDRDVLLQATNAKGYRMGRYLAAYAVEDLQRGKYEPLWTRDDFLACAHNGARVADLDMDGRDDILGPMILGPDGKTRYRIPLKGHVDSVYAVDVRPDLPGLEVVALEEGGGNRVFLYNSKELIWQSHYKHQEPQNAAVGNFVSARDGLEVWCRSRYNTDQKPFVFGAKGDLIFGYEMKNVAPKDWTNAGVEVISTIDWTGGKQQLAAAKERHTSGDVAIFDGSTGAFVQRFSEKADRLYVADVTGDWREELIVLNGDELHVYHNETENPRPDRPRLWTKAHYRRSKMTWNYYSP